MLNFRLQESNPELLNLEMSPIAHCLCILKMSVINACFARRFLKSICDTHLSTLDKFLQHVGNICCLYQRTPLKLQMCCYVSMGFNRTHLFVLTIRVITLGQY